MRRSSVEGGNRQCFSCEREREEKGEESFTPVKESETLEGEETGFSLLKTHDEP